MHQAASARSDSRDAPETIAGDVRLGHELSSWTNYTNTIVEAGRPDDGQITRQLAMQFVLGEDTPERQRNSQRNLIEKRIIDWMTIAERP